MISHFFTAPYMEHNNIVTMVESRPLKFQLVAVFQDFITQKQVTSRPSVPTLNVLTRFFGIFLNFFHFAFVENHS